jgi:hypothetical protein
MFRVVTAMLAEDHATAVGEIEADPDPRALAVELATCLTGVLNVLGELNGHSAAAIWSLMALIVAGEGP